MGTNEKLQHRKMDHLLALETKTRENADFFKTFVNKTGFSNDKDTHWRETAPVLLLASNAHGFAHELIEYLADLNKHSNEINFNAKDSKKQNMLFFALRYGNLQNVETVLDMMKKYPSQFSFDINDKNEYNKTVYFYANKNNVGWCSPDCTEVATLLSKNGGTRSLTTDDLEPEDYEEEY